MGIQTVNDQTSIVKWGTDYLVSTGYSLLGPPEILLSTPWSTVVRFPTAAGNVYLKETAPSLALEPKVFRLLTEKFHARVPDVIAINDDLHCFLSKDAGIPLRPVLKAEFRPDLLCRAIKEFAAIQRSTEEYIDEFLGMGIPDWRLDKLPLLYDQMVNQTDFLKTEGITDDEMKTLRKLSPHFSSQCELLSNYGIPATLGFHDFHDNNILIDPATEKMTFIDFGETSILHPFFSLYTCLWQSIKHHRVKKGDQIYQKLQNACFENWLEIETKDKLLEAFTIAKHLWSIYSALDSYRVMTIVDLQFYRSFYANRPSLLAAYLREYMVHQKTKDL